MTQSDFQQLLAQRGIALAPERLAQVALALPHLERMLALLRTAAGAGQGSPS